MVWNDQNAIESEINELTVQNIWHRYYDGTFDVDGAYLPIPNMSISSDSRWYTIDGGTNNYTFSGTSGSINSGAWSVASNGTVTIIFYVNDTIGNLGSSQVIVRKDILAPTIAINSPTPGQIIGSTAPSFNVEITDPNLDTMWYTIDNGLTNFTFIVNGTIDQINWAAQFDGSITLIFYANDTSGNVGTSQVLIIKDTGGPAITINSPSDGQVFNITAPNFIVDINDINLDTMWYTIDNGITNITFIVNGTIDQNNWTAHIEGSVTLIFYANDTLGNIGSSQIVIIKDILEPIITINTPTANQTIGSNAPSFNLTIIDYSLDQTWYSLYNGTYWSENFTFTGLSGVINQALWNSMPEGAIVIKIFANDSLGRMGYANVTVFKQLEIGFDLLDFLLSLPGIITMSTIGAVIVIVVIVVKRKRGGYKSKDKEIRRIEEIRRKPKEELK